MKIAGLFLLNLVMAAAIAPAHALTADEIDAAVYDGGELPDERSALVVRLQILLDRAHSSPGVIDGFFGENVDKAVQAFRRMEGLGDGSFDLSVWNTLPKDRSAVTTYTIAEEDFEGLVESVPTDFGEMAEMEWLGYTSVEEKLAERFHMDLELLALLNPRAGFSVGDEIVVADVRRERSAEVSYIEVDRQLGQVRAYGEEGGKLIAAYPATVGSRQNPSPTGTHQVTEVVIEPSYSYRPGENFQQGDNDQPLEIPPGPNGPVGLIWIGLSEPSYGLHGTAEPENIDKNQSHGCVRLTNWDARSLADKVSQGTIVEFVGA